MTPREPPLKSLSATIEPTFVVKLFRDKSPLLLTVVCLVAAPVVRAQTSVTVDQMERLLDSLTSEKESAATGQLAHLQLTERVSPQRLAQWQSHFKGQLALETLLYLADASSTCDLPDADLPPDPPPDDAASDAILERGRQYVRTMRPRLPNFSATRSTTSFQVSTLDQMQSEERQLQSLQLTDARMGFRSMGAVAQTM